MLMLSNANNTAMCYNDINDKFWGQRTMRRPKVVPRAAAGYSWLLIKFKQNSTSHLHEIRHQKLIIEMYSMSYYNFDCILIK